MRAVAEFVTSVALAALALGCWRADGSGAPGEGDADADTDSDVDADTDVDSDSDTATETGSETDTGSDVENTDDGGSCAAAGAWYDPDTGLCWFVPPTEDGISWADAMAACDALEVGAYGDWRLPLIQELITLIRGCVEGDATGDLSASACGVTDPDCLASWCFGEGCLECNEAMGPYEPEGCYWNPGFEVAEPCDGYWSASSEAYNLVDAWAVNFRRGSVRTGDKAEYGFAACVRGET